MSTSKNASGKRSAASATVTAGNAGAAVHRSRLSPQTAGASMDIFEAMNTMGHEQLLLSHDPSCGYFGIIAIHDTTLGPALGGTRFWQYQSTDEAVTDALRLARGMTYKSAVAGINLGGGKSVIIGDNKRSDREALFRAHGRFIETLGGRYITAEDIGTSPADMEYIKLETDHVAGLLGLSGRSVTGHRLRRLCGNESRGEVRWGSDSLEGKTVAVQGAGKVAYYLMQHLHAERCQDHRHRHRCGEGQAGGTGVWRRGGGTRCHLRPAGGHLAPCALGATINDETLPRLKVEVIAGGANNQLAEDRHGDELERRGILYAPDYVINGGGVINVYGELHRWPVERAKKKAGEIYDTLLRIFDIARQERIPTYRAADRLAEQRIAAVAGLDRMWMGKRE